MVVWVDKYLDISVGLYSTNLYLIDMCKTISTRKSLMIYIHMYTCIRLSHYNTVKFLKNMKLEGYICILEKSSLIIVADCG